jgi:hypothetical protein
MKTIKTNTVLLDMKGKVIKHGGEDLTIGYVVSNVLGGKVSNPTLGWSLGKKFATEDSVDLKAEDIVFIKNELEKPDVAWFSVVLGQVIEILESKD